MSKASDFLFEVLVYYIVTAFQKKYLKRNEYSESVVEGLLQRMQGLSLTTKGYTSDDADLKVKCLIIQLVSANTLTD